MTGRGGRSRTFSVVAQLVIKEYLARFPSDLFVDHRSTTGRMYVNLIIVRSRNRAHSMRNLYCLFLPDILH